MSRVAETLRLVISNAKKNIKAVEYIAVQQFMRSLSCLSHR
jgi:hypothetical protein